MPGILICNLDGEYRGMCWIKYMRQSAKAGSSKALKR